MRLVAPGKKPIRVRQTSPNQGVEAWYRARLLRFVDAMAKDVERRVTAAYRDAFPALAQDSKASRIADLMDELADKWVKTFEDTSRATAEAFVKQAAHHQDVSFGAALHRSGFSVKFQQTKAMRDGIEANVEANVSLIKSIPTEYMTKVQGAVLRSVQAGRRLKELTEEIQRVAGVTRSRAVLIARDQNNKATAFFHRARQKELGITKACFLHSAGSKDPREEHAKWSDEETPYDIEKGMYSEVDDEYVWPGTPINCGCVAQSIIEPDEEDEDEPADGGEEE